MPSPPCAVADLAALFINTAVFSRLAPCGPGGSAISVLYRIDEQEHLGSLASYRIQHRVVKEKLAGTDAKIKKYPVVEPDCAF